MNEKFNNLIEIKIYKHDTGHKARDIITYPPGTSNDVWEHMNLIYYRNLKNVNIETEIDWNVRYHN